MASLLDKVDTVTRIHNLWLSLVLLGRNSLTHSEYLEVESYGKLPMDLDLSKSLAILNPDLAAELIEKGLKEPKSDMQTKPASLPGVAAPGNVAGPGRPPADEGSPKPAATESQNTEEAPIEAAGPTNTREIMYLPKKDYPKAPAGVVGSTDNSWKVPVGLGRQLQANLEVQQPTSSTEAAMHGEVPRQRETTIEHLSRGKIASKKYLDGDNTSDTFKIVIQGNGSGIMKPQVGTLRYLKTTRVDTKPEGPGWSFDSDNNQWVKETTESYDPYHPSAHGTFGAGNITPKKNVQREVAAYSVASLHGMNQVPVTVARNDNGQEHSIQQWKEGFSDIPALLKSGALKTEGTSQNEFELLKSLVPKSKHKHLEETLMDIAVYDIVINNNDRHASNFLVNPKTGDIALIDHGFSFCNSVNGLRNHFLHNTFHGNKPIKMSKKMLTRLKNQSLSDYKRAITGLQDWEIGQTFLRNRYVVWLQENHGSIDRNKFLHTMNNNKGTVGGPGDLSNWRFAGKTQSSHWNMYGKMEEKGTLPHQLFESWAKAYIQDAKSKPNHPDHHDAKALYQIGVFMKAGFPAHTGGAEGYRKEGKHREYENSITASFDIPESVSYHMGSSSSENSNDSNDEAATKVSPESSASTKVERHR